MSMAFSLWVGGPGGLPFTGDVGAGRRFSTRPRRRVPVRFRGCRRDRPGLVRRHL